MPALAAAGRIAIVVKGYPRLSETFIAQEILALEERGLALDIWSLRHPTERFVHPMHERIVAPVTYLPEYLHWEPTRVLRGLRWAARQRRFTALLRVFLKDLKRDPTPNRLRRLGQACVMAHELPPDVRHLHVHYLHTPASVVRYVAILRAMTWSFSAHAKDIWTTPAWEKREKIAESLWGVACTSEGRMHLSALAGAEGRIALVYHGLDLKRFPDPPARPWRNGANPAEPVRIVSVGRAVPKKGFDDLLTALATLPADLNWQFVHIGGGDGLKRLQSLARRNRIEGRVEFMGPRPQPDVIALLREADLFVLPSKAAASGDRDGLPNVLMEAASQAAAIVASDFAAIPEFIGNGREGVLVAPGDWASLSNAIKLLARDPERRLALGQAARKRLIAHFTTTAGIDRLEERLRATLAKAGPFAEAREPVLGAHEAAAS